jgi:hypothetical protein
MLERPFDRLLCLVMLLCVLAPAASARLLGPKGGTPAAKRATILRERDEILGKLYRSHPEARAKLAGAVGYATFNDKNWNLFLLSASHGYGVVVDKRSGKPTYMAMGSVGGGLGLGAKSLRAVFIFHDAAVMERFIESGWQFGGEADATAKAADKGAAAAREGALDTGGRLIEVYQMTRTGFALQATIAGTKYWKDGELNR